MAQESASWSLLVPGAVCLVVGLLAVAAIVVAVIVLTRKRKAAQYQAAHPEVPGPRASGEPAPPAARPETPPEAGPKQGP